MPIAPMNDDCNDALCGMTQGEAVLYLFSQLPPGHQCFVSDTVMRECKKTYPDTELARQVHSDTFARLLGVTTKSRKSRQPLISLNTADLVAHSDPDLDGRVGFIVDKALNIAKRRGQRHADMARTRWGAVMRSSDAGYADRRRRWVQPPATVELQPLSDLSVQNDSDTPTCADIGEDSDDSLRLFKQFDEEDTRHIVRGLFEIVEAGIVTVDAKARAVLQVFVKHPQLWAVVDHAPATRFPNAELSEVLRHEDPDGGWDSKGKEVANARARLASALRAYGRRTTGSDDLADLYAILMKVGRPKQRIKLVESSFSLPGTK
jgi:hypothetical protein